MTGPWLIPLSLILTLGTFGGASLYALNQPIGKFNSWGSALTGVLVSCIIMNLAGLGSMWILGPNMFSKAIFTVYPYIGVGLFTAF